MTTILHRIQVQIEEKPWQLHGNTRRRWKTVVYSHDSKDDALSMWEKYKNQDFYKKLPARYVYTQTEKHEVTHLL